VEEEVDESCDRRGPLADANRTPNQASALLLDEANTLSQ
jgi:hypothetical protein